MSIKNVATLLTMLLIMLTSGMYAQAAGTTTIRVSTSSVPATGGGTITPVYKDVKSGSTAAFTVKPLFGYSTSVTGCGGTLKGTSYKTGAIASACTVEATFTALPMSLTITTKPLTTPISYSGKKGVINFSVTGVTTGEELLGSVNTSDSWITRDSLTYDKKGKGALKYTVKPNESTHSRTGSITIAGKTFSISQTGEPCKLTLTPSSTASLPVTGGSISVGVAVDPADAVWSVSGVKWSPSTSTGWLHGFTTGEKITGASTLTLSADFNETGKARSVVLTFASDDGKSKKTLSVKQATRVAAGKKVNYVSAVSSSFDPTTATPDTNSKEAMKVVDSVTATTGQLVPIHWVYKVNEGNPVSTTVDDVTMGITINSFEISINPSDFKRSVSMLGSVSGSYAGITFSGKYQTTINDLLLMDSGKTYLSSESLLMGLTISAAGKSMSAKLTSNVSLNPPFEWFLDRENLDQLESGYTFMNNSNGTADFKLSMTGEGTMIESGIPVSANDTWTIMEKIPSLEIQGKTYSNVVKVQRVTEQLDLSGNTTSMTMYYWVAKGVGIIKGQGLYGILGDDDNVVIELVNTNLTQ